MTGFILDANKLVPNIIGLFLDTTGFVLNRTGFVLNRTGCVLYITGFYLNITGFILKCLRFPLLTFQAKVMVQSEKCILVPIDLVILLKTNKNVLRVYLDMQRVSDPSNLQKL